MSHSTESSADTCTAEHDHSHHHSHHHAHTPKNADSLISAEGLGFSAGQKTILHDVSFSIARGEIMTIIGPNGAGKSTLVKCVLDLLTPTAGKLHRAPKLRVGYVPQKLSLDHTLPMKVDRFLSLANVQKEKRREALQHLSISKLVGQQMQGLSGGELQRVLLARAISREPDLLVLDEPLQGVDITGQIELYKLIASLRNILNCAILMVSHDLHLVMAQTDSVLCLNQHVCCHGKPESVSQHPEYLKLFGQRAIDNIAVYQHHHDHHHNLHGDTVDCNDDCNHL